jgi:hypothetical protein
MNGNLETTAVFVSILVRHTEGSGWGGKLMKRDKRKKSHNAVVIESTHDQGSCRQIEAHHLVAAKFLPVDSKVFTLPSTKRGTGAALLAHDPASRLIDSMTFPLGFLFFPFPIQLFFTSSPYSLLIHIVSLP